MAYQQQHQQRPGFERGGSSQRFGRQRQGGTTQAGQRGGIGQQQGGQQQGGRQMGGQQMGGQQMGGQQQGGRQMGGQQMGGQQQGGQQMGGQQMSGQQMGIELEDALSGEMRLTLHDFVQSALVCEWCADQCLDEGPQMAECVRLCRDVADLALQNVRFIARDSVYGPELAETFVYAAEECAQECSNHPHEHCQECASTLRRAAQSTRELIESIGRQPQGQQQGQ